MAPPELSAAASAYGVLMGLSPVLQIRRMLREKSSRDVSLGYFLVLLAGFSLWVAYGLVAGNLVLVVPNAVALLVGMALVIIALRLRGADAAVRSRGRDSHPGPAAVVPEQGERDRRDPGVPDVLDGVAGIGGHPRLGDVVRDPPQRRDGRDALVAGDVGEQVLARLGLAERAGRSRGHLLPRMRRGRRRGSGGAARQRGGQAGGQGGQGRSHG
jgi:MtN3 and saliva related transmembrane protein